MLKIRNEGLVAIAGIVWLAAGLNILRLGVEAWAAHEWVLPALLGLAVGAVAVFGMFHVKIFSKMVGKHVARIRGYVEARSSIFKFFDARGYVMMAIMMGGGIALRMSGLVPDWFIAFFYTGIGFALSVAGVSFLGRHVLRRFGRGLPCPFTPSTWHAQ